MNPTFLNINVLVKDDDTEKAVLAEIAEALGCDSVQVTEGHSGHWDAEAAGLMKDVSRRHPGVIIEVWGDGAERDDMWAERFRDGRSELVSRTKDPVFADILTEYEAEHAFRDARERYDAALADLRKAAVRRIRTLKERITGAPDRFLWLNRLNDLCSQLVIADSLPLSNREYVPLLVTGIHDDGEAVSTEEDPVCIPDMLPEDITALVDTLEGYAVDIEKGFIRGRWNEEEEWYELYNRDDEED